MNTIEQLSPASRVWIYQSTRPFLPEEQQRISMETAAFARSWTAHNQQLKAWGGVVEDRFVVLMVDESMTNASGCSIDTSVHFIQELEKKFGLELFNRLLLTYKGDDGLHTIALDDLAKLYQTGGIDEDTLVVNTLVTDKADFDASFFQPLKENWAFGRV